MVEPKIDTLRAAARTPATSAATSKPSCGAASCRTTFVQHTQFVDRIVQFPELILTGGVRAAAAEALAADKSDD